MRELLGGRMTTAFTHAAKPGGRKGGESMERIDIICIGTLKEKFMRELAGEYMKRMARYCKLNIVELAEVRLPRQPSDFEIRRAIDTEAQIMLDAVPKDAYKIAMCVEGLQLSSPRLAQMCENAMKSRGKIAIFIGSSYGLSETLKSGCNLRLSMSSMTFPHQLARCMLLEQLYRSYKIRRKETYHK